jgi:hypothetical protein
VFANYELAIASFLVNRFRTHSSVLFLNALSFRALVEAMHFGKMWFVMAHVLSSLMRIFSCRRAEVWKFEPNIFRALHCGSHHSDATALDPGQTRLAGHAMRHTLQIHLRSVLDQSDHWDVVDGLNEEQVLVVHSEKQSSLTNSSQNLR